MHFWYYANRQQVKIPSDIPTYSYTVIILLKLKVTGLYQLSGGIIQIGFRDDAQVPDVS